jgi:hypothetical protein
MARRTTRQTTPAAIIKPLKRRNWRREEKNQNPKGNAGKEHSRVGIHGPVTPFSASCDMNAGDQTPAAMGVVVETSSGCFQTTRLVSRKGSVYRYKPQSGYGWKLINCDLKPIQWDCFRHGAFSADMPHEL